MDALVRNFANHELLFSIIKYISKKEYFITCDINKSNPGSIMYKDDE